MNKKPIILFLSWRDLFHPSSGGAEVFTTEMIERCSTRVDNRLIHFSTSDGSDRTFIRRNGVIYLKKGNWLSVIFHAIFFYYKNKKRIKFVVDQCNSHRFFTPFWVPRVKRIFFIHQMTREIWRMKLPFPFSVIGESLENVITRIYSNDVALTVSESTKKDLVELGFNDERVFILPEGIHHEPSSSYDAIAKDEKLFLYVGRYSEYKGLPDAIKAFALCKEKDSNIKLVIVGKKNSKYIDSTLKPLCTSLDLNIVDGSYRGSLGDVTLTGRVSEEDKLCAMGIAKALIFPSKREGWGLTISESAVFGTPSIVYNSPGLVDAVDKGRAGYLCEENSAAEISRLMYSCLSDQKNYRKVAKSAYDFSKVLNWNATADCFDRFMKGISND